MKIKDCSDVLLEKRCEDEEKRKRGGKRGAGRGF
jgi:hypothetical protein